MSSLTIERRRNTIRRRSSFQRRNAEAGNVRYLPDGRVALMRETRWTVLLDNLPLMFAFYILTRLILKETWILRGKPLAEW